VLKFGGEALTDRMNGKVLEDDTDTYATECGTR
jgi:hypothetical protein